MWLVCSKRVGLDYVVRRGWGWFLELAAAMGWGWVCSVREMVGGAELWAWLVMWPLSVQIAKLIQKLANTSSVREDYMMPLEPFVKLHNEALKVSR